MYTHDRPFYVRQMPRFNDQLTDKDRPIGRLRLKLYGTKPACHIYHAGLDQHLCAHDFLLSEADPCLYTHQSQTDMTLAAVTIDDFLLLSTSYKRFNRL